MHKANNDRCISGIFIDLPPTGLTLFLQCLERWINLPKELKDDRGRNVGHDAQAEDCRVSNSRGREQGNDLHDLPESTAVTFLHLLDLIRHRVLIDERQRNPETHAIHGQQSDREQDLASQLRNLPELDQSFDHASRPC